MIFVAGGVCSHMREQYPHPRKPRALVSEDAVSKAVPVAMSVAGRSAAYQNQAEQTEQKGRRAAKRERGRRWEVKQQEALPPVFPFRTRL